MINVFSSSLRWRRCDDYDDDDNENDDADDDDDIDELTMTTKILGTFDLLIEKCCRFVDWKSRDNIYSQSENGKKYTVSDRTNVIAST